MRHFVIGLAAIAAMAATPAAAKQGWMGVWTITDAQQAPWVSTAGQTWPDEAKELKGKHITFNKDSVLAPAPMSCTAPKYSTRRSPPEGLFQGGLTAAAEQAKALGFKGRRIRTVETSCEGLIDYHFIDDRTAMFALNNMLYTIKKQ